MDAPRMTYYARVIDNITNKEILNWIDTYHSRNWYFGKVCTYGGESQYMVEFDIWNNEPAWNAGAYDEHCEDATNCRLTVWSDTDCLAKSNVPLFNLPHPFMYARCITNDYKSKFEGIRNGDMLTNITGNVNPNHIGLIHGNCDHSFIQTKIVLPEQSGLDNIRYNFIIAFYYDYED
jgi:hypothetical protein